LMAETFERVTLERVGGLAKAKAATIEQFTADRRRDVESIAHLVAPHLIEMRERQARKDEPPTKPAPEPLPELKDAEALKGNPPPEPNPLESPPPDEPPAHPPSALDKRLAEAASALRQKLGLILWDQQEFEELLVV